ncbi:sensor histidine kinase inhibitor, KipI family [Marinobacter sp. LV10R510-11A]|uniref:5-oxoprolinase subunit PxpB n=1 Tax=Marinobacter sp. LV10R510-11A TaxID=1415568 RepID=UPI000BB68CA2|nr:5-oxoprolinase subunit PxpB [Marinobacter sp. LV10R510-11A]SOB77935.1 sensor histidine kinase inhibitor, KipI family [Marinobacter sp. LV10R510-11A]
MNAYPRIENAGISAWLVRLFDRIDENNLASVMALCRKCEEAFGSALVDLVPSYTTLLVHYDPRLLQPEQARLKLQGLLVELSPAEASNTGPLRELPVWYEPTVGPDLSRLAEKNALSVEELVELHAGTVYQVFALGFAPGFAFMGSVDPRLEAPRLATPRPKVYAGSVAIAGRQTSAYPSQSPGGWNLLGRTPVVLFDHTRNQMSYLQVGDRVQMVPVSKQEFLRLGGDSTPQEDS